MGLSTGRLASSVFVVLLSVSRVAVFGLLCIGCLSIAIGVSVKAHTFGRPHTLHVFVHKAVCLLHLMVPVHKLALTVYPLH